MALIERRLSPEGVVEGLKRCKKNLLLKQDQETVLERVYFDSAEIANYAPHDHIRLLDLTVTAFLSLLRDSCATQCTIQVIM